MAINEKLLEILVCPETHQPLAVLSKPELEKVNRAIERGELRASSGELVKERLSDALLRADGSVIYPVVDGVPLLLVSSAIELPLSLRSA